MSLQSASRLLRTVRHLRYSQVLWRAHYLVERRRRPKAFWDLSAPHWSGVDSALADGVFPQAPHFHHTSLTGDALVEALSRGEFRHLNRSETLDPKNPRWPLGGPANRLWNITLHYHAWLYELAAASRAGNRSAWPQARHYLEHWLNACDLKRVGPRNLVWNSFSIATRLAWWAKSLEAFGAEALGEQPEFTARWLASFAQQAEYLAQHVEWDLRANHVLRDAVGLAWAGRVLRGPNAERWLKAATDIAVMQASEQVLADGGHFERSPMYHVQVMEDFLALALLVEEPAAVATIREAWQKMAAWLVWMRHPDGQIPLFNDGGLKCAAHPTTILAAADRLGLKCDAPLPRGGRHLADTGMVVWHGKPWTLFFDVGPIATDYNPAHGHADTLTLEASFAGNRLLVDPGNLAYDNDAARRYDRATASHNTVTIDGVDSSEVWDIFRVGRRAKPLDARTEFNATGMRAEAAHDGYDHLPGCPRHGRSVTIAEDRLEVVDRVSGGQTHVAEGGWLLAPGWRATARSGGWLVSGFGAELAVNIRSPQSIQLTKHAAKVRFEYGAEVDSVRLAWRYEGPLPLEVVTVIEPE